MSRTEMTALGSFAVLSYGFSIESSFERASDALELLLAPFARSDVAGPVYRLVPTQTADIPFGVERDGVLVHRGTTETELVDWVLWDAYRTAITSYSDDVLLHASAASWQGRGILFPAPPDAGKSTLVTALVASGLDYHSDEMVPLLADGRIGVAPRALWLEHPSMDLLPEVRDRIPAAVAQISTNWFHVPVETVRSGAIATPAPLDYVIAPQYRPGNVTALTPARRAEIVVLLAEQSFNLFRFGAAGLRRLRDAVAGAACYRLAVGDLQESVDAVRDLVGATD